MSAAETQDHGASGTPRKDAPPVPRPAAAAPGQSQARPRELGGPAGPEPTRYGDWEKSGRCIDF